MRKQDARATVNGSAAGAEFFRTDAAAILTPFFGPRFFGGSSPKTHSMPRLVQWSQGDSPLHFLRLVLQPSQAFVTLFLSCPSSELELSSAILSFLLRLTSNGLMLLVTHM
jgi:hypothetical protein